MATTPKTSDGQADPEKGIRCRACGCGHFYTTRTTKVDAGRVRRERRCRHCGKRLITFEKAFGTD